MWQRSRNVVLQRCREAAAPPDPDAGPARTHFPTASGSATSPPRGADSIEFDLACLTANPTIDGGYRLENVNPKIRTLEVQPTTVLHHLTPEWRYPRTAYSDWFDVPIMIAGGVWLYLNGGSITVIVEQFFA